MKRLIISLFALFVGIIVLNAQPRAIGASLGWSETATYQHSVSSNGFFEMNLGYHCGLPATTTFTYTSEDDYYDKLNDALKDVTAKALGTLRFTATYNFICASPNWTTRGEWNFYAGPGLTVGSSFNKYKAFCAGVTGQAGLEFAFWFPLQISVDMRPTFGLLVSEGHVKYDIEGLMGFVPTLSVKYRF